MLEARNLNVAVNGETFLEDLTFTAEPGRIYVLMGRTGAGKSSLMRAMGESGRSSLCLEWSAKKKFWSW